MINTDYMYSFEKDRLEKYWNSKLTLKNFLQHNTYNDAILLPPITSKKLFGDGGVLDRNLNIVPESYLKSGKNNSIIMGGGV